MKIYSNNDGYVTLHTENNDTLYLFSQGYVLNEALMTIYRLIGENIELNELREKVYDVISGDHNLIDKKIDQSLALLKKRELISYKDEDCAFDSVVTEVNNENDLLKKYNFIPVTQIDLILTKKCNFSCKHCFLHFDEEIEQRLNKDNITQICQSLKKYGLKKVVITGGEPLTHIDNIEIISNLCELGLDIILLTNGYLINDKFITKLSKFKSQINVQVSLDGSNSESNNFQRGKEDAFIKAVDNIIKLKANEYKVHLSMVLNKKNISDIYDGSMFNLAKKLGTPLFITTDIIKSGNGKKNEENSLSVDQSIAVTKFVHNYKYDKGFPTISISGPPSLTPEKSLNNVDVYRPRCRRGVNSFAIRPDGEVVTCSDFSEFNYREYHYGNILDENLSDILENAKNIQNVIMNRYLKTKGVCSICKELPHCGGACRAAAFAEYNDILAPYPLCQKMYDKNLFPKSLINENAVIKK